MNTNNTTYGFDNCNSPFNKHKPTCIEKITQIEKALQELKENINNERNDNNTNNNNTNNNVNDVNKVIINKETLSSSPTTITTNAVVVNATNMINKHLDKKVKEIESLNDVNVNNNTNTKFYLHSESIELWENFAKYDLLCFYAFEQSPLLLCHLIQEMFHICYKFIKNVIKDKYTIMSNTFNIEANEENIKSIEDLVKHLFRDNLETNFFNSNQTLLFYTHFIKEFKHFFYTNLNMQFDKDDRTQQFEELIQDNDLKTCVLNVEKIILFCEFNSPQLKIIDVDVEYPHRKIEIANITKHSNSNNTKNDSTIGSINNNSTGINNNNNNNTVNSFPIRELLIPNQPDIKSIDNVLIVLKPPVMFKNNLKYSPKYKTIAIINNNTTLYTTTNTNTNNSNTLNTSSKNSLSACNTITNHVSLNSCIGLKQLSNPNLCTNSNNNININTHSNKNSFVYTNGINQTRHSTHILTKQTSPSMVLPQSPILTSKSPSSNNNDDGSYQGCMTENNNGDGYNNMNSNSKWKYSHTNNNGGLYKNCLNECSSVAKRLDLNNVDSNYTVKNKRNGTQQHNNTITNNNNNVYYNNNNNTKHYMKHKVNYIASTTRGNNTHSNNNNNNNRNKSSKDTNNIINKCKDIKHQKYHHRPKENIIRMIKQQSKQTLTQTNNTKAPIIATPIQNITYSNITNTNYSNINTNNNNTDNNKTRTNSNTKMITYSNSIYQYPRNRKKPSLHEDKLNSVVINNKDVFCFQSTSNSKPKSNREQCRNFPINTKAHNDKDDNDNEIIKMLQHGQLLKKGSSIVKVDKSKYNVRSNNNTNINYNDIQINSHNNTNNNHKKVSYIKCAKAKNNSVYNKNNSVVTDNKVNGNNSE